MGEEKERLRRAIRETETALQSLRLALEQAEKEPDPSPTSTAAEAVPSRPQKGRSAIPDDGLSPAERKIPPKMIALAPELWEKFFEMGRRTRALDALGDQGTHDERIERLGESVRLLRDRVDLINILAGIYINANQDEEAEKEANPVKAPRKRKTKR